MPGLVPLSKDKKKTSLCQGSRDPGTKASKASGAAALPHFSVDPIQGPCSSSKTHLQAIPSSLSMQNSDPSLLPVYAALLFVQIQS